jgi:hypothetical protein
VRSICTAIVFMYLELFLWSAHDFSVLAGYEALSRVTVRAIAKQTRKA